VEDELEVIDSSDEKNIGRAVVYLPFERMRKIERATVRIWLYTTGKGKAGSDSFGSLRFWLMVMDIVKNMYKCFVRSNPTQLTASSLIQVHGRSANESSPGYASPTHRSFPHPNEVEMGCTESLMYRKAGYSKGWSTVKVDVK